MNVLQKKFEDWFCEKTAKVNLIFVGLGGAGGLAENSAKLGIGSIHLIDPKLGYSDTNVITQRAGGRDVGKAKAEVLAKNIEDILVYSNPNGRVESHVKKVQDADLNSLINPSMHNIIVVNVDNIPGQVESFRFAWQNSLDMVGANSFRKGIAGELLFTIGQETPCGFCLTRERIEATKLGFKTAIDSHSGTIFSASLLNAIVGHFLLMLIFRECPQSPWYDILDDYRARNKGFVSMLPNAHEHLGLFEATDTSEVIPMYGVTMVETKYFPDCEICGS